LYEKDKTDPEDNQTVKDGSFVLYGTVWVAIWTFIFGLSIGSWGESLVLYPGSLL